MFILPSLVKSVTGTGTDWEDLVNAKTLSIGMSFFSFAWSFYTIRYREMVQPLITFHFRSHNL